MKKNKVKIVIGLLILLVLSATVTYVLVIKDNQNNNNDNSSVVNIDEPKEKENINAELVSIDKAEEISNTIPKIYSEVISPFSDYFMMETVINQIIFEKINVQDLSRENIEKKVKTVFGSSQVLDLDALGKDATKTMLYYYSPDEDKFIVEPFGFEFIYFEQVLKEVTEDENNYYLYRYCFFGEYIEQESEEKLYLVFGDKDGEDIVEEISSYDIDIDLLVQKYKEELPIFKYTLKKDGLNFYITKVEQTNY